MRRILLQVRQFSSSIQQMDELINGVQAEKLINFIAARPAMETAFLTATVFDDDTSPYLF